MAGSHMENTQTALQKTCKSCLNLNNFNFCRTQIHFLIDLIKQNLYIVHGAETVLSLTKLVWIDLSEDKHLDLIITT